MDRPYGFVPDDIDSQRYSVGETGLSDSPTSIPTTIPSSSLPGVSMAEVHYNGSAEDHEHDHALRVVYPPFKTSPNYTLSAALGGTTIRTLPASASVPVHAFRGPFDSSLRLALELQVKNEAPPSNLAEIDIPSASPPEYARGISPSKSPEHHFPSNLNEECRCLREQCCKVFEL